MKIWSTNKTDQVFQLWTHISVFEDSEAQIQSPKFGLSPMIYLTVQNEDLDQPINN